MCTVYTGRKKKSLTGLQRGEEAGRCGQERRLEERTKGGTLFTHYVIPDRSGGQWGQEFRRGITV